MSRGHPTTMTAASAEVNLEAESTFDIVVIGSGMGGLSAAGVLARSGRSVCVCEAHDVCGGAAHSFQRAGYDFDSGPSLLSGLGDPSAPASSPLRQILNAIDEDVEEWVQYSGWRMITPQGDFDFVVGDEAAWLQTLKQLGSEKDVIEQWRRLQQVVSPLSEAVTGFPANALRSDLSSLFTIARFLPNFLKVLLVGPQAQAPFARFLEDAHVTDKFLLHWFDYLCFVLQALPAARHQAAPVAFMMEHLYTPGRVLDYPKGGVGALVAALVRGVEKHGGEVRLRSPVEEILLDTAGHANGVKLKSGKAIMASEAVISNASAWDTEKLLPGKQDVRERWRKEGGSPDPAGSFLHLHLGFRADGLPETGQPGALQLHYSVINDWEPVDGPGNVVIVSIPSVVDPSLAPKGRHCLHAYVAASESYDAWDGLDRQSEAYKEKKRQRCAVLWKSVEKIIPDIRSRAEIELLGTPLTHARFLRRHRGTYGPYSPATTGLIPSPSLPGVLGPVPGLLRCGDSVFPGIGVPSSAASGVSAAAAILSVEEHVQLLDAMRIP